MTASHTHPVRPMRRPITAALGLGAATLALCLVAGAAPAEAKIVPGQSVAGVKLGDSAARVRAVLGAPERGSNLLNARYIRRHGLGVYFIAGRVFDITVVRRPQAAKGIRVGSARAALTRAYPKAVCRKAVAANTVECTLPGKLGRRATRTLFTVKRGKVASISVSFR